MKRRQFIRAAAASSTIAIAGCGGGGEPEGPQGSTEEPDDAEIAAEVTFTGDRVFDPVKVEVEAGEAVQWNNQTGSDRTLKANTEFDGATEWDFDINVPAEGNAYFTFEEGGLYAYHDQEETRYRSCGAVAVGDSSADDIPTMNCE